MNKRSGITTAMSQNHYFATTDIQTYEYQEAIKAWNQDIYFLFLLVVCITAEFIPASRWCQDTPRELYRRLIIDPEFEQAVIALQNLLCAISRAIGHREESLTELKQLKEEIEESYDKSRKARIAGSVTSVCGSGLAILGFGLSFVTLGVSLGIAIPGTLMAAAGGITFAGADIGYFIQSSKNLKKAQRACSADREMINRVRQLHAILNDNVEALARRHSSIPMENIWTVLGFSWNIARPAGRGLWNGYKLIDSMFEGGKAVITAVDLAKLGGQVGRRALWSGLSTTAKVLGIVGVVFDAALIPVDLAFMIKSAYDVHKYKKTGKSNSNAAAKVGKIISELERNQAQLIELYEALGGDYEQQEHVYLAIREN